MSSKVPLKAKKYLALPIQSILGCLKELDHAVSRFPFFRLHYLPVCSQPPKDGVVPGPFGCT